MVMEVVHEDIGEESMQCVNHSYKNSSPGGICAFCLQEKLGKLVSSSYPSSVFPSSSSSSSTRSAVNGSEAASGGSDGGGAVQPRQLVGSSSADSQSNNGNHSRKGRLPFVLTHKKKKKTIKDGVMMITNGSDSTTGIALERSKSTATPRRRGNNNNNNNNIHFMDGNYSENGNYSPNKRGFWSFLYLSKHSTPKNSEFKDLNFLNTSRHSAVTTTVGSSSKRVDDFVTVDDNNDPGLSFESKVSRSRSVGCGSRSFSGDFFDRISTGFGDCTLRRVESQREGNKVQPVVQRNNNVEERVKCGGIFSGLMMMEEANVSHSMKSRSWVWAFASPMSAFASPMRAFARKNNNKKNATPNLDDDPSLLTLGKTE